MKMNLRTFSRCRRKCLPALLGFIIAGITFAAEPVLVVKDVVYCVRDGRELCMDIAYPTGGAGPHPALIFIFGQGFHSGTRKSWSYAILEAANRGYVAAAVDYRLTSTPGQDGKSKYPFPRQVEDVKYAVRWLRASAEKYRIDEKRIGTVGFCAGGNLALMLGLTGPADGLEGEGLLDFSSTVQAVVNLSGPTDMVSLHGLNSIIVGNLLGGTPTELPDRYKAASPVSYVKKDSPPILSVIGELDLILPHVQTFDGKIREAGASHTLIVKPKAEHGHIVLWIPGRDEGTWEFLKKALE
jgi:acetyl esterase/lipase